MSIPAVRKSVTVNIPVDQAFKVFIESFGSWWPPTYHIGKAEMAEAVLEPTPGGRWYERGVDGSECDWGRVLAVDPPRRLTLSWHLNDSFQYDPDPAHASRVEVNFVDLGNGQTRVDLHHDELDQHDAGAAYIADAVNDESGWSNVLARYAELVTAR